jgi:GT2 family glycosyltransferase
MILSVRCQTFVDWELLVIDDGSTDDSATVAAAAADGDPRIRIFRQVNGGVCRARNAGEKACSPNTRYLLFLDADDVLEPSMLDVLRDWLEGHPEAALAFCDFRLIDAQDRPLPAGPDFHGPDHRFVQSGWGASRLPRDVPNTPFEAVFALATIIPSITLMRREVFAAVGGWDESFGHVFEDTDLFLRMTLAGAAHFIPQSLVRHRRHSLNSTSDPTRVSRQRDKLYTRWLARTDLTPTQRLIVEQSWQFLTGRLGPLVGFQAGCRQLATGRPLAAARFWAGAAIRYLLAMCGRYPSPPTMSASS